MLNIENIIEGSRPFSSTKSGEHMLYSKKYAEMLSLWIIQQAIVIRSAEDF